MKILNMLKNTFRRSESDIAIKNLQKLGKRLIHGLSADSDIVQWESGLEFVDERIKYGFDDLFLKYLLKHYPKDDRLKQIYPNTEDINAARDKMYREMLLLTIGDALYILKYKLRDFRFKLDEWKHECLIKEIEEYVYYKNKNREQLIIKINNKYPDDFLEKKLEGLLTDIYEYMPYEPYEINELLEWRIRARHIDSFKYLEWDTESVFRRRQKLDLKHGFLLGEVGSGKTKAIQKEIELIIKDTNDDIIIIDNDGSYEEFCYKNHGEYIKITTNSTFFDSDLDINNRLVVLSIYHLSDAMKLRYALKTLAYAYQKMDKDEIFQKNTWLYIEEMNDLIFNDYFTHVIKRCRKRKGIITVASRYVADIIENSKANNILFNYEYIRVFKQSESIKKDLAEYLSINPDVLEFEDIETSWSIIENETIKIRDNNIPYIERRHYIKI